MKPNLLVVGIIVTLGWSSFAMAEGIDWDSFFRNLREEQKEQRRKQEIQQKKQLEELERSSCPKCGLPGHQRPNGYYCPRCNLYWK